MAWKKTLLIAAWSLAALAWVIQLPVLLLVSDKTTLLFSFGGAIVLTELAFYATAGLLGMTLVQSRKKIWATIKAVFGKKQAEATSSIGRK